MSPYSIGALGESNESPSRSQIEAYAGIRLPAGATDVRARLDQVLTKRTMFVRLSLDLGELDAFLRDSRFGEPLSADAFPELLRSRPRPDWFVPEQATRFVAGETARSAVLVATDEPERPVVYVVARS